MTYNIDKAEHILNMLKKHGFIEYWPPSRTRWFFRKDNIYVDLIWSTLTTSCWRPMQKERR